MNVFLSGADDSVSPVDIPDDDYPTLPSSPHPLNEPLKPFLLRRSSLKLGLKQIEYAHRYFLHIIFNDNVFLCSPAASISPSLSLNSKRVEPSPSRGLTSIVINGWTYYASDDAQFQKMVPSSTLQSKGSDNESAGESLELVYPPGDPPCPQSHTLEDYDKMDIDLPDNYWSLPALRTPSPDLPANPLDSW